MAPNEHLKGGSTSRATLFERLTALRATAGLDRKHPDLTFSLLPWVLGSRPYRGKPVDLFFLGATLLAARYEELGLLQRLPFDRVWVGVRSRRPAFGGFHHPDQGYRHLQMGAVITRYGDLADHTGLRPELVALDLLRAYAHDCLHYGTYREYRLWGDEIGRARYGINSRARDGRTYSSPDPAGSTSTRNLGIVMEGATDREAKAVTRQAAQRAKVSEPSASPDRYLFRDVTGSLEAGDLMVLRDPVQRLAASRSIESDDFLRRMGVYNSDVGARYELFLAEIGRDEAEDLHTVILGAMISGSLTRLSDWLDRRHGPKTFTTLFKASSVV
ncbi:hypothetical protein [Streptosporangium sp. NPDC002721]|uniref:hypothetical protein n=1 Tax=Streptosporangium sp. NPDC002721 TaxID=3366188 RepID=UPI00368C877C